MNSWRSISAVLAAIMLTGLGPVAADETEELTVTSSKKKTATFDAPEFVSIITYDDILRRAPAQVPDLLQWQAGILVQKTNLGGGSPFIRGLTGKQILLLVDGVRLNNSLYRFGPHQYLNTFDPGSIERIEIVRGPMSVMYGSDALGGVVNVITRERDDFEDASDLDGMLSFQYGTAARNIMSRAAFEGNVGKLGFIGGLTYRYFDDLVGGRHVGLQKPTSYKELDADLKLNMRWGARHELILAQQLVRQFDVPKTSEVTLGDSLQYNYEPQFRYLVYASYRAKNLLDPWLTNLDMTISYQDHIEGEQVIKKATPDVETKELNRAQTFGMNFHITSRPTTWQAIDAGAEFYYDLISSEKKKIIPTSVTRLTDPFPDGAWYWSFGVYAQDEIRVLERLSLTLGGRYNRVQSQGTVENLTTGMSDELQLEVDDFTGTAHVGALVTDWLKVVAGVGQGFRAPNMEDFFGKIDFSTEIPNLDLKSERSVNYEAGFKIWSRRVRGEIFYFYSTYDNLIDRQKVGFLDDNGNGSQDSGERDVVMRTNIGEAVIQGVEADLWLTLTDYIFAYGTASWTRGDDLTRDEPLRRIPPFTGSLGLRYDVRKYWLAIEMLGAGKQDRLSSGDLTDPRIPAGGTPAYAVLNMGGGVNLKSGLEFNLKLENLLDATYKSHGSGVFFPGTQAVLTARWRF